MIYLNLSRKEKNSLNEQRLNKALHARGINKKYQFSIYEREVTAHSLIYGDTTFTCWSLALYRTDGDFSKDVIDRVYDIAIKDHISYEITEIIIATTLHRIDEGHYDFCKIEDMLQSDTDQEEIPLTAFDIICLRYKLFNE